ncbi:MAG: hypothetical protein IT384_14535 [Deltaproteobacteria bacterium]|nr:hypothetical protein [Deltaproteobacteria bacterium]
MIPIVVDLGKAKSRELKALEAGAGPLFEKVQQTFEQVRAGLPKEAVAGKRLVPVVVVYRKKAKSRRGFPF